MKMATILDRMDKLLKEAKSLFLELDINESKLFAGTLARLKNWRRDYNQLREEIEPDEEE